ncbi:DUF2157 domain-containing protein [Flagellimonas eckloniae]|uniref:DUF2157 domain-containing protein n=1 Tax=Flagellimonas eckloniae TaxID=346185 RepID=A0A0Q1C1H1_9FLAO|nr:DUF2157 domain-containing protein [Allomuricauda eckloniae]KQC31063.1 hypothetical protein AAY42_15035 [Allomuricauda eckloniae]
MSILKDLQDLIEADIITQETAEKIKNHYKDKGDSSINRLFVVFGILGAILVGLGIILIIAHNWDELSKTIKTIFAFLPLVIGQLLCGYALIKKNQSIAWKESTSTFLFFGVGASISLVSQVYNIPGDLSTFILTWMLICLPIVYVMNSSLTSLFFIVGITYYATETSYWSSPSKESYLYWPLLLSILPHYYQLFKKRPKSNFMVLHNWFVPLSVLIVLGTLADKEGELMMVAYFSLFGLFYLIGNLDFFTEQKARSNGYKLFGSLGMIILLLTLSFSEIWEDLRKHEYVFKELITTPEFIVSVILTALTSWMFYVYQKNKSIEDIKPLAPMFIVFAITFIIGHYFSFAVVLINLLVLAIGILTIRNGAEKNHLGILNYGLAIIAILITCRFFDTDLSFVVRGILFVLVGVGFFATNYWMLRKRKKNEH